MSKILNQIEDAEQKEGKIVSGGKKTEEDSGGYFLEPTIIENDNEQMLIAEEETFGPVASIFTFKTEEEHVERANPEYNGLEAKCYTSDMNRTIRMIHKI